MASFGERIKREREMRGVSLEEIAESTKIGKRNLEALETEDFDKLPGGIFNKGFVRAYAKYLGLDEDQAVTDFLAAENAASTGIRLAADPVPALDSAANGDAAGKKSRKERSKELEAIAARREAEKKRNPPLNPTNAGNTVWVVIAIVCLGGGSFAWWRHSHPEHSRAPIAATSPALPAAATLPPVVPAPVTTSSNTPVTMAPENAVPDSAGNDGLVHLKVHAIQDSWIQVTVDGKVVQDGTLDALTDKSYSGKELIFKTGNAGGIELSYNGKTQAPFGKDNQVKQIKIKPEKKPAT
ncbi:MAG: helix-turn-helix domain-containing protein [Terriglobales bacterium]